MAVRGLAPTICSLRPSAVRSISVWTATTVTRASSTPQLTVLSPSRARRSSTARVAVCGTVVVGSLKGILTSTLAKLTPRKLIISVEMISLMPWRAFR